MRNARLGESHAVISRDGREEILVRGILLRASE